jgi:hypothetical protein
MYRRLSEAAEPLVTPISGKTSAFHKCFRFLSKFGRPKTPPPWTTYGTFLVVVLARIINHDPNIFHMRKFALNNSYSPPYTCGIEGVSESECFRAKLTFRRLDQNRLSSSTRLS